MYQPPPGRPISSPPNVNGHDNPPPAIRTRGADKFTQAEKMALRADYAAGLSWVKIATKYNTHNAAIASMTADMPRRPEGSGRPRKDGRPVRNPGESAQQYANRVQLWKRATDPAWRAAKSERMSVAIKKSWRKRKARAERERAAAEAAKAEPLPPMPQTVPTPPLGPTLWQRIMGWFR